MATARCRRAAPRRELHPCDPARQRAPRDGTVVRGHRLGAFLSRRDLAALLRGACGGGKTGRGGSRCEGRLFTPLAVSRWRGQTGGFSSPSKCGQSADWLIDWSNRSLTRRLLLLFDVYRDDCRLHSPAPCDRVAGEAPSDVGLTRAPRHRRDAPEMCPRYTRESLEM